MRACDWVKTFLLIFLCSLSVPFSGPGPRVSVTPRRLSSTAADRYPLGFLWLWPRVSVTPRRLSSTAADRYPLGFLWLWPCVSVTPRSVSSTSADHNPLGFLWPVSVWHPEVCSVYLLHHVSVWISGFSARALCFCYLPEVFLRCCSIQSTYTLWFVFKIV